MIHEGSLEVIAAIKEKKQLMDANLPHDHLRILCICGGGLIKGAYSVGVGWALEELGYTDVFDHIVGVSSGAPSAAYYVGGNVRDGGSLIYEECCSRAFFSRWRFWNLTDVLYLTSVLEGKTGKSLSFDKIFSSRTKLHIGVASLKTGKPKLITPNNRSELLDAISASILMPTMSNRKVCIAGQHYMDGGFSSPHVIGLAAEGIDYTHVLVLTSQNKANEHIPLYEHFLNQVLFRHRSTKAARKAIKYRKSSLQQAFDAIRNKPNTQALFVWGDNSILGTETNTKKVVEVVRRYKNEWLRMMS